MIPMAQPVIPMAQPVGMAMVSATIVDDGHAMRALGAEQRAREAAAYPKVNFTVCNKQTTMYVRGGSYPLPAQTPLQKAVLSEM